MELLLISNANFHSSAGDITLMIRRATAMEPYGIETTFLSIVNCSLDEEYEMYKSFRFINTDPNHRLFSICEYIKEKKPAVICLYGNTTLFFLKDIRRFIHKQLDYHPKMYIDMQGALEEAIDYKSGIDFLRAYPAFLAKKVLYFRALSKVDGVFTVSDEMFDYCKRLSRNPGLENIKIRCGLIEVFSSEEKFKKRGIVRKQWGIDDDSIVMCYSGYRSPWQNVDQIIELYGKMDKIYDNLFFAFFCNTDTEFEKELKTKFPRNNYVVKLLSSEYYFLHLCACDVGFLIRDDNTTNRVAFPNKFSDYLNAGLLCYISESLKEPNRVLKMAEVPYIKAPAEMEDIMTVTKRRQRNLNSYYSCAERACQEFLLFDSQYKNQNLERLTFGITQVGESL